MVKTGILYPLLIERFVHYLVVNELVEMIRIEDVTCHLFIYYFKLFYLDIQVEDFVDPNGKISLIREETPSTQR